MSGGMLMVWLLVWIASIGVPAAMRPITGTATGRPLSSSEAGADAAEIALDHARGEAAPVAAAAMVRHFGQLDHLDGARAIGQPADEAALLQRRDQPVDAGFGAQIERILHLVEGGRHAGFLQAFVDEAQKLELLAGQHRSVSPGPVSRGP